MGSLRKVFTDCTFSLTRGIFQHFSGHQVSLSRSWFSSFASFPFVKRLCLLPKFFPFCRSAIHLTAKDLRQAAEKHPIGKLVKRMEELLPSLKLPFQGGNLQARFG
jgi:hypothetical protein